METERSYYNVIPEAKLYGNKVSIVSTVVYINNFDGL